MTNTAKILSHRSAGSSLIELALSLPLLMILMVGIADFGRYVYASIEVVNAAHAGALYGALNPITACDNLGMIAAAKADAGNVIEMTATASGSNTSCSAHTLCACVATPQTSSSAPTLSACSTLACTAPSRSVQYVQVNTTATISPILSYPGYSSSWTLTGQAIMRTEQ